MKRVVHFQYPRIWSFILYIYRKKKLTSRKIQKAILFWFETSWMWETSLQNYLSLQSCDCAAPGDESLSLFRDNPTKILWSRHYHSFTGKRKFFLCSCKCLVSLIHSNLQCLSETSFFTTHSKIRDPILIHLLISHDIQRNKKRKTQIIIHPFVLFGETNS